MPRPLLAVVALLLAVTASAADWRSWLPSGQRAAAVVQGAIVASGHVEATEHHLAAKVGGRIEEVAFEEGDRVRAGQTLARISTVDARLALAAARAEQSVTEAELALRLAGSRSEDIADALAQVRRAETDLAAAERDLSRDRALLTGGAGTKKTRDDSRARRDAATWALESARERLSKLRAGSRAEEIALARARVAAAGARVAQAAQELEDACITSPIDGVATEKLAEKGELASRGTPVAVVTDLAHPWLTVYVMEPDLGRVRLGQEATVFTDDGSTRKGRVAFISTQAEFTPKNVQTPDERAKLVFRVKLRLDNSDGLFKPGMPASARLTEAK